MYREEIPAFKKLIGESLKQYKTVKIGSYNYRLQKKNELGIINIHFVIIDELNNIDFTDGKCRFHCSINLLEMSVIDGVRNEIDNVWKNGLVKPEDLFFGIYVCESFNFDFIDNDYLIDYNKVVEFSETYDWDVDENLRKQALAFYHKDVLPLLEQLESWADLHNVLESDLKKHYFRIGSGKNWNLNRLIIKALSKAPDYNFCKSVVFDSLPIDLKKQSQSLIAEIDRLYNESETSNKEFVSSDIYYIPVEQLLEERKARIERGLNIAAERVKVLPLLIGKSLEERQEIMSFAISVGDIQAPDNHIREIIPDSEMYVKNYSEQIKLLGNLILLFKNNPDLKWEEIEKVMKDIHYKDIKSEFKIYNYTEFYAILWRERYMKAKRNFKTE